MDRDDLKKLSKDELVLKLQRKFDIWVADLRPNPYFLVWSMFPEQIEPDVGRIDAGFYQ